MARTLSVPFVDLRTQHAERSLITELQVAVAGVLREANFILGEPVSTFEEAFADYCGTDYAIGVDNGTAALELALRAYGIGAGDEVILPANTYIATAFAVTHAGATPVLVDADPETYTIDVSRLEDAITARTKAIIPVHLYGQPADMAPICALASTYDLVVIEDACQAHGATYNGTPVGSLGDAAAFSFYPTKNLGACGDAGMVVTNDPQIARTIRVLRNQGQHEKNHHVLVGHNHRLDTVQAAVLSAKLPYLDEWNAARRRHARHYNEALARPPGASVVRPPDTDSRAVYHLYVIRSTERDELRSYLREQGVATGIHYPIPIHLQPAYRALGYGEGSLPVTEAYAQQILSLPMYPELKEEAIEYVADVIHRFEHSASR